MFTHLLQLFFHHALLLVRLNGLLPSLFDAVKPVSNLLDLLQLFVLPHHLNLRVMTKTPLPSRGWVRWLRGKGAEAEKKAALGPAERPGREARV